MATPLFFLLTSDFIHSAARKSRLDSTQKVLMLFSKQSIIVFLLCMGWNYSHNYKFFQLFFSYCHFFLASLTNLSIGKLKYLNLGPFPQTSPSVLQLYQLFLYFFKPLVGLQHLKNIYTIYWRNFSVTSASCGQNGNEKAGADKNWLSMHLLLKYSV